MQMAAQVRQALLRGDDVIAVAPPGLGKTLTFQIPLCLDSTLNLCIVTPLTVLGEEQADSLNALGLPSVTLRGDTMTPRVLEAVGPGQHRVVVLSPEIFNSPRFQRVILSKYSKPGLRIIIIDEAHVVKEWASFREEYPTMPFSILTTSCTLDGTAQLYVEDSGNRLGPSGHFTIYEGGLDCTFTSSDVSGSVASTTSTASQTVGTMHPSSASVGSPSTLSMAASQTISNMPPFG
ncbi:hypothetical protein M408DRAFT_27481 [Serendipita vermifera MAFF 305830]|uniref:Helicase ATP-binding domain-containing protein n=1 Tax=Serendipita vermifera MAFF 305830 TaxID=933852 RepID=A0A0C3AV28_SERVB|nr:hypothetical protein M408DRAFT_27481 [Serendipita vermifera MAFF 305830]